MIFFVALGRGIPRCLSTHSPVTALCALTHKPVTVLTVKSCYSFGILALWRVDCNCRKKFLQFFTPNAVPSISEAYAIQIEQLKKEDKESQAKTKATLQRIRLLIKTLESIEFAD
jgi:hypothetical protein